MNSRERNQLIVGLNRAVEATFTESDWMELGYATDTHDYVTENPRLLRSLSWRDDDYGANILRALSTSSTVMSAI